MEFTHIDPQGSPKMVDVGSKAISSRVATAEAVVWLPESVYAAMTAQNFHSAKGPVLQTAIIAGTQAAKKTADLIPFCHPLAINGCTFSTETQPQRLIIRCSVSVDGKTGVEMEALTAVSVAALTVYDMCKALSAEIRIESVRLIHKRGGKSDVG